MAAVAYSILLKLKEALMNSFHLEIVVNHFKPKTWKGVPHQDFLMTCVLCCAYSNFMSHLHFGPKVMTSFSSILCFLFLFDKEVCLSARSIILNRINVYKRRL